MTLLAKRWLLGVAAATLVAAGACERRADQRTDAGATKATRSDAAVTTNVQAKYFADSTVKGHRIDVDTNAGVVTLTGTVENDAQKARAVQLAQNVDGVSRVEDRLRVEAPRAPTAPADRSRPAEGDSADTDPKTVSPGWITTKIQSQYFMSPDVKGHNINVTTSNDGRVTLNGTVETAAERQEAVRIARATDGVRDVNDQLAMKADKAAPRPNEPARDRDTSGDLGDGWTTAKIQAKYFLDGDVKGHNINVNTNNGVVTLQGEVETAAEKRQAVALARATDGVSDVRDELRIVPDTDAPDRPRDRDVNARDATQPVGDAWVTAKIQSKYFLDRDLKARDINVTTNNGVVTLQGRVDNDAQKREAEAIAKETRGVNKVDNKLTIGPNR